MVQKIPKLLYGLVDKHPPVSYPIPFPLRNLLPWQIYKVSVNFGKTQTLQEMSINGFDQQILFIHVLSKQHIGVHPVFLQKKTELRKKLLSDIAQQTQA